MKISVNHPQFEKGVVFGIPDIGAIPNGSSVEVDDDTIAAWEAANGTTFAEAVKNNDLVNVAGKGSKGGES